MISVWVSIACPYKIAWELRDIIMMEWTILEIAVVSYEPDDDVKEKKLVTLTNEVIPFYLEKLDDIVKENDGYFANKKVIFDLVIFEP
jgi:hypothetical protein